MTIECYYAECPNHAVHTDPEDGPFCHQSECTAAQYDRERWAQNRLAYLCRHGFNEVETENPDD